MPGPVVLLSVAVLCSGDPELLGVAPPSEPDQAAITDLVRSGGQGKWAQILRAQGVKYILVAHEVDWRGFQYLDDQADIVRIGDYGSMTLYRNSLEP